MLIVRVVAKLRVQRAGPEEALNGQGFRGELLRVAFQKSNNIGRMRRSAVTVPRPRDMKLRVIIDGKIEPDPGLGAIGHQNDAVAQIEGLVDVMRHHHHGFVIAFPERNEQIL